MEGEGGACPPLPGKIKHEEANKGHYNNGLYNKGANKRFRKVVQRLETHCHGGHKTVII